MMDFPTLFDRVTSADSADREAYVIQTEDEKEYGGWRCRQIVYGREAAQRRLDLARESGIKMRVIRYGDLVR
jgi:hypothetical protein